MAPRDEDYGRSWRADGDAEYGDDLDNARDEGVWPGKRSVTHRLRAPIARKADGGDVERGSRERVAAASSSSGSPLPDALRDRLENSLGADLRGVRAHTGADSAEAARAVGARAYTTGADIHFATGQYDPSSTEGQRLIAHEAAHTVQQAGSPAAVQTKLAVSQPGDAHEVEADRFADAFVAGSAAPVSAGIAPEGIHRKGPEDRGSWTAPFGLGGATDRPGASAILVDLIEKMKGFKDAGFNECQLVIDRCNAMLMNDLHGADELTKAEADKLNALGILAFASHQNAMNEMKTSLGAALSKWMSPDMSGTEARLADLLHAEFTGDEGKNKLTEAKKLYAEFTSLTGKIEKYAGYGAKAKSVIAAAQKFEDLEKGMKDLNEKLKTITEVIDAAEAVATLAGQINQRPGSMQNDIGKIRAGFVLVDLVMSKTSVPIIGTYWEKMVKPAAEACLNGLAKLDKLAETIVKSSMTDWWEEVAQKFGPAPQIDKRFMQYFPGGQPMLNFMWSLMKVDCSEIPPGIEDYFLKFKSQFNAANPHDEIEEQSNWKLFNPSTWGARDTSPNLAPWVNKHKREVWAMLYGSLPHP